MSIGCLPPIVLSGRIIKLPLFARISSQNNLILIEVSDKSFTAITFANVGKMTRHSGRITGYRNETERNEAK